MNYQACVIYQRENTTNFQPSKNSQITSAEEEVKKQEVTKQDVKEVLKFIENSMETLTAFEKRFNEQ